LILFDRMTSHTEVFSDMTSTFDIHASSVLAISLESAGSITKEEFSGTLRDIMFTKSVVL